jgi:hypothetical protein
MYMRVAYCLHPSAIYLLISTIFYPHTAVRLALHLVLFLQGQRLRRRQLEQFLRLHPIVVRLQCEHDDLCVFLESREAQRTGTCSALSVVSRGFQQVSMWEVVTDRYGTSITRSPQMTVFSFSLISSLYLPVSSVFSGFSVDLKYARSALFRYGTLLSHNRPVGAGTGCHSCDKPDLPTRGISSTSTLTHPRPPGARSRVGPSSPSRHELLLATTHLGSSSTTQARTR